MERKSDISVLATKLIDCVVCDVENVCHHGRVKIVLKSSSIVEPSLVDHV